jgi:diguanylate cyclase (GGDEF)-like protein
MLHVASSWVQADRVDLAGAVLDSLTSCICVLSKEGIIVAANRAWREFSRDNGGSADYIGWDYLAVCEAAAEAEPETAGRFAVGLRAVLTGQIDHFQLEYPCPSTDQPRWFLGRVTALSQASGQHAGQPLGAVVSHQNITERRLLEERLKHLASTDPLTGLTNRRRFMEVSAAAFARAIASGRRASLILFDLDHFKQVNDTQGHGGGDNALEAVAEVCRRLVRDSDLVARIGGEEFAVLLPRSDSEGAALLAERLRREIENVAPSGEKGPFRVSASFGVAGVLPTDAKLEDAMSRADAALYEAKRSGRNRVRVHP